MNSKAILMLTLSNVGSVQPGCLTLGSGICLGSCSSVGGCLVWHFHIIFEYYMRISISSSGLQQNVCPSIGGSLWGDLGCGMRHWGWGPFKKGVVRCTGWVVCPLFGGVCCRLPSEGVF